ncbi:hypothetical protein JOC94_002223 [Bacillus thermophilus]|uniref:Uncharacterized protein n=1 Tax=Siminovitchia thermophila TaxID=1245522 RepID=A0ABS2R6F6_9BACI|nr:hypothetical protein [Siminovitchia thermophila]MBM7715236.1 hypothetical protein [Siminovitchia thermophila]
MCWNLDKEMKAGLSRVPVWTLITISLVGTLAFLASFFVNANDLEGSLGMPGWRDIL